MANGTEIELPANYKPTEKEPFMNDRQKEYFRRKLMNWKEEIISESKLTLTNLQEDMGALPDLADRASTETDRSLELRARDRQRKLISKIDSALRRIEELSGGRPVLVSSNGVSTTDDEWREHLLSQTLEILGAARRDGVNVVGYLHDTGVDGYEWRAGFETQRGVIDRDRNVKLSGETLAAAIAAA